MPAFVAPFVGLSLGALLAWAAGGELSHHGGPLWTARSFVVTLLFAGLVYGPAAAYFACFETDWAFAYLLDTSHPVSAVVLVSVALDVASVVAGFALASRPARKRRMFALLPLVTVPNAAAMILVALLARRLSVHGTTAEYRRDFGLESFAGSPAAYAVLFFGACLLLGTTHAMREIRGPRKRAPSGETALTLGDSRGIGKTP